MFFVSQKSMNQRADVWGEDAGTFRPGRFAGVGKLRQSQPVAVPGLHPYAFVPFGAGQRTCVGQRLAGMETLQILASVAKNFDLELWRDGGGDDGARGEEAEIEECADITLGPKSGLRLRVIPRAGAGNAPKPRL